MGNGKSKNNIRDNLKCKDWKIIERQDPDRFKNLDKWVKKYKFEGQLKTTKLIELRGAMKEKTKRDPRKMKKEGDEDVVFWLKVAGERERGEKEKVEKALYCRKEDDETGPNGRQARDNQNLQRAREEGGGVEEVEKRVGKAHATTSKHKVIEKLYPQVPDTGAQDGSTPPYGLTDRATRQKNPIEMDWSKEMRANYTEIGRTKQNDNETFDEYRVRMTEVFKLHSGLVEDNAPQGAYQQQLKNAIHVGSRPAIQIRVINNYIGMTTGTLEEYINHALHAERVVIDKQKRKQMKAPKYTFLVDQDSDTFYQNAGRGQKGQRGRGAMSNREGFRGRGRGVVHPPIECWSCGEKGHMARDCTYKQKQ
nr:uncharacterized protein LOC125966357 [Syngnathus scovelli]XP_049596251.1 uncharacterized protein LOC125980768 [Syngnathus scovelli]